MPFGAGAQAVGAAREIVRVADRFRQQAVFGRHFVERGRHQRVVDAADAGRHRTFHPPNHDIEIVERPDRHLAHQAAARRLRIDVVEMLEAGRVFQFAKQRQSVPPGLRRHRGLGLRFQRAEAFSGGEYGGCERECASFDQGTAGQAHGLAPVTIGIIPDCLHIYDSFADNPSHGVLKGGNEPPSPPQP